MLNAQLRWLFGLGAYSPLLATLYVLLILNGEVAMAFGALALAGLGLGATATCLASLRPEGGTSLRVADVVDAGDEYEEYLATWAPPLLAAVLPISSDARAILLAGSLALVAALYTLRGRLPANPLLAACRQRLLVVSGGEGPLRVVLSSRAVERGDLLRLGAAQGGLFVVDAGPQPASPVRYSAPKAATLVSIRAGRAARAAGAAEPAGAGERSPDRHQRAA